MRTKRANEAKEMDENSPVEGVDVPAKKRKRTAEDDSAVDGTVKKSKKDKKDKKSKKGSESRKERKEKRKDLQDLPEQDDEAEDDQANEKVVATEAVVEDADKAKAKAEKKAAKKAKKEKKAESKSKKEAGATNSETTATNGDEAKAAAASGKDAIDLDASTASKADRHIVFVGNLPFSATAASISAHFSSLSPVAVRCLKNKGDDKPCRGIAFVEFGSGAHMRTCLDKFHHSMFDDGKSAPRQINVELTAGGGGKGQNRKNKIDEKNVKLDENRAKRIEKEQNAKTNKANGTAKPEEKKQKPEADDGIHPSRRGQMAWRK